MVLNWIQYSQVENRSDERVPCPGKGREGGKGHGHRHPRGRERPRCRLWCHGAVPGAPGTPGILTHAMVPVSHFHQITWKRPGRALAKSFLGGFFFFFGLKFRGLHMVPLGLGGGGAPRAWPRCHHGCARPWLQGQASSPWIRTHGSVSYPNYCPESCMGTGWPCPACRERSQALRASTGSGEGQGAGRELQLHTTSPISFGNSNCEIPPVHRIAGGAGLGAASAEHPVQPIQVGLGRLQRGNPTPALGSCSGLCHLHGKKFSLCRGGTCCVYVCPNPATVGGDPAALSPPVPSCGTCPQPCCCGTGPAWPGHHGAPVAQQGCAEGQHSPIPIPHPQAVPRNKHPDPP